MCLLKRGLISFLIACFASMAGIQSCSSSGEEDLEGELWEDGNFADEEFAEGNFEEGNFADEEGFESEGDGDFAGMDNNAELGEENWSNEGNWSNEEFGSNFEEGNMENNFESDFEQSLNSLVQSEDESWDMDDMASEETSNELESIISNQSAAMPEMDDFAVEEAPVAEVAPMVEETAPMVEEMAPVEEQPMQYAPTPAPANASGVPQMGSKMPVVVRVGDTMSSLAQKIYGDAQSWREMAELTAIDNPNIVRPGDVVYYKLSETTMAFATAQASTERFEVVVQPGDTLSGIAQQVYGSLGDWKYIWRQNASVSNPDRIEVGQTIYYLGNTSFAENLQKVKDLSVEKMMEILAEKWNSNVSNLAQDNVLETNNSGKTFKTGLVGQLG